MTKFYVQKIENGNRIHYVIRNDEEAILKEPAKFLKHKNMGNRSPNTIKKLAYEITYYLCFLYEISLTISQVLKMKYAEQQEHFSLYLCWLSDENHTDRKKHANNNTCNSYLQGIFRFYQFILWEYSISNNLKVLENRHVSYISSEGVNFRKRIMSFQGYLPQKKSQIRLVDKDEIIKLIKLAPNMKVCLILVLLAETGLRIGELLGIRMEDIDFENRKIGVVYRENNANGAREKNAEERTLLISEDAFELLCSYIVENRRLLAGSQYLFVVSEGTTKGEPLKASAVYSAFNKLQKKSGIKFTPHILRHFFADERRRDGIDLLTISKMLGHKSLATTENYLHLSEEEMNDVMESYFERNAMIYELERLTEHK